MKNTVKTFIKSTFTIVAIVAASSNANAANAIFIEEGWDGMMGIGGHIMHAGDSITASNQETDKQAYTSNPVLDSAAWGHLGHWYTFMTHETANTTITVDAVDPAKMSPGFTVWRTDGMFDGGTGSTGETSTKGIGTPHSFNQTGSAGDYGTWWMTDDSVAISDPTTNGGIGFSEHGILETLGYASDGPSQSHNGWGNIVTSDGLQDGHAELTLNNLQAGWFALFVGGADGSLAGSHVNITVSTSPVPVPAAVYLFGTALMGMLATSRRRKSLDS